MLYSKIPTLYTSAFGVPFLGGKGLRRISGAVQNSPAGSGPEQSCNRHQQTKHTLVTMKISRMADLVIRPDAYHPWKHAYTSNQLLKVEKMIDVPVCNCYRNLKLGWGYRRELNPIILP